PGEHGVGLSRKESWGSTARAEGLVSSGRAFDGGWWPSHVARPLKLDATLDVDLRAPELPRHDGWHIQFDRARRDDIGFDASPQDNHLRGLDAPSDQSAMTYHE